MKINKNRYIVDKKSSTLNNNNDDKYFIKKIYISLLKTSMKFLH